MMQRLWQKKLAAIIVLGLSLLAVSGCGSSDGKKEAAVQPAGQVVQVKSEKEADLVPLAKKEGKLRVYSITSRVSKAAAAFEKKYGIKVEATDMKDFELIDKISTEVKAKAEGADMVICQDSGRIYGELLSTGYLQNYVPADLKTVIPEANQSPLVFMHMNKVLLYNNENGKAAPITNLWQLTEPANKGKFFFKSPLQEGINANFLTMLTKPEIAAKLSKAYEDLYHKKLETKEKNAGYEWIKQAFSNGLIMGTSDTAMTESIGVKGQNITSIGLLNYSKARYAKSKNLAVAAADKVAPICGFYYPEYALLVKDCKHPAAAKLFIQFLLTEEGYKYWQSEIGSYSGNPSLKQAQGDKPLTEWQKVMIGEDPQYIFEHRADVEEFVSKFM